MGFAAFRQTKNGPTRAAISKSPSFDSLQQQQQKNTMYSNNNQHLSQNQINRSDLLHNSASNLPMPSPKLQAAYITNLLDNDNTKSSQEALKYLTDTRGLTKQTLRKYGIGLGSYQFPSIDPGQHNRFVKADCVTFPWIMKASEVNEQESLRGGSFHLKTKTTSIEKEDGGKESNNDVFVTRRIKARSLTSKANQRLDPPG